MSARTGWRLRRGMTLVEVMVAVVVLLVMAMIVAESLRNAILFNDLLTERDQTARQARVAMARLKRDIQLAFLTPHQRASENYTTVFVGLDQDPDVLFFDTLAHRRIYRDSRECDQAEITVWAEDAPKDQGEGLVLYHREDARIDEEPAEGGVIYPLAYHLRSFNVRYLDSQTNEWVDQWDTRGAETPYRLPRAVEVGLVLITPSPEGEKSTVDVPFLTTIMLQFGQRLTSATGGLLPGMSTSPGAGPLSGTPLANNPFLNGGQTPGGRPGAGGFGGQNPFGDQNPFGGDSPFGPQGGDADNPFGGGGGGGRGGGQGGGRNGGFGGGGRR